jgi:hypothetical protein
MIKTEYTFSTETEYTFSTETEYTFSTVQIAFGDIARLSSLLTNTDELSSGGVKRSAVQKICLVVNIAVLIWDLQ